MSSAARFSTRSESALRVGILGAGRIAEVHLKGLQQTSAVVKAVRTAVRPPVQIIVTEH